DTRRSGPRWRRIGAGTAPDVLYSGARCRLLHDPGFPNQRVGGWLPEIATDGVLTAKRGPNIHGRPVMCRISIRLAACLLLGTCMAAFAADGHNRYRWHDADGALHYGD